MSLFPHAFGDHFWTGGLLGGVENVWTKTDSQCTVGS